MQYLDFFLSGVMQNMHHGSWFFSKINKKDVCYITFLIWMARGGLYLHKVFSAM